MKDFKTYNVCVYIIIIITVIAVRIILYATYFKNIGIDLIVLLFKKKKKKTCHKRLVYNIVFYCIQANYLIARKAFLKNIIIMILTLGASTIKR